MDRQINYPGQVPLETDLLKTNQNTMVALSKLSQALFGATSGMANGFATSQTVVPSLAVLVAPGEIYSLQNLEATAVSSLSADTTHSIVKQGIALDTQTIALTPPGTAGFSTNYLIQVGYQDADSGSTVLPYYNASNPAVAYSGPANSGAAQPTVRQGAAVVTAKAGTAAATGSQTTPAPDAGKVGLYVVTVANGASSIVNGNISVYSGAPLINNTLHGAAPAFSVPLGVALATTALQAPQLGQVLSAYGVRGLAGGNNSGTPATQFDFKADLVTFRNPTTGATATVANVATITNNVLTAGPTANGRDQSGAFSSGSWVHFYYVYNGATVATVSSANAPPTGPTLPTGYTSWAYIGAVYYTGGALAVGTFRGSWFHYAQIQSVLTNGTAGTQTNVSLATVVPPNALSHKPIISAVAVTSNGSGTYAASVVMGVTGAAANFIAGLAGTAGANLSQQVSGQTTIMPNVGQNIFYYMTFTAGSAPVVALGMTGYSVPNGGE